MSKLVKTVVLGQVAAWRGGREAQSFCGRPVPGETWLLPRFCPRTSSGPILFLIIIPRLFKLVVNRFILMIIGVNWAALLLFLRRFMLRPNRVISLPISCFRRCRRRSRRLGVVITRLLKPVFHISRRRFLVQSGQIMLMVINRVVAFRVTRFRGWVTRVPS